MLDWFELFIFNGSSAVTDLLCVSSTVSYLFIDWWLWTLFPDAAFTRESHGFINLLFTSE